MGIERNHAGIAEIEVKTTELKDKCITLLNDFGEDVRRAGVKKLPAMITKLMDPKGISLEERLNYTQFESQIEIDGQKKPEKFIIKSYGSSLPRNAAHLIIYVPHINKFRSLDVGATTPKLKQINTATKVDKDSVSPELFDRYFEFVNKIVMKFPHRVRC